MHRRTTLATATTLLLLLVGGIPAVRAQAGLVITTPYPAISVQPGASASFTLTLTTASAARVTLAMEGLPDGWTASFTGGGNEISAAYVQPGTPSQVTLNVDVPADASGSTQLTVVASAAGESARLVLDLNAASQAGGSVALESDYPSLRGSTDSDFQFNLTLRNDTPQQLIFTLSATGPSDWDVSVQPSGQAKAASVTVPARGTQRLEVTAKPPTQAAAASYQIGVLATAGEHQATADLTVEVTGTVQMSLTSSDQRLNATASAGGTRDFAVVVSNDGTSPLSAITLSGSGPSQWTIDFEPASIDQLAPGETANATAHITPSGDAVAGDYAVTLTAQTQGATESIDVRVTVETPPIWGIVGIGLIVATLGGMLWIFRRYGRR